MEPDRIEYMPGFVARTTPKGIRVLELDYWCDPDHTHEWVTEQRRLMTPQQWRREMERDWTTPEGLPYFPSFNELGGRDTFVYKAKELMKGPVIVGFDFGRRYPAMGCFQYSPASDRLWFLREFLPADLFSHEFRDACRFLLGLLPWSEVPLRGQQRIEEYCAKPTGIHCPPWPRRDGSSGWFPPGTQFVFVGGKEAMQGQANVTRPEDSVVADIFAEGGMPLLLVNPRVQARNQLIGRYLRVYPDTYPGLIIDPQCEETIIGFEGVFAFPKPTPSNPYPTDPKNDGYRINLLDAWGYGVSAVCPEEMPVPKARTVLGYDGRNPVYAPPDDSVGWNEVRPRLRRR